MKNQPTLINLTPNTLSDQKRIQQEETHPWCLILKPYLQYSPKIIPHHKISSNSQFPGSNFVTPFLEIYQNLRHF